MEFVWVVVEKFPDRNDHVKKTECESTEEAHKYLKLHGYLYDKVGCGWFKPQCTEFAIITRRRK